MRIDTSKNQTSLVICKSELLSKFNEIKKIVNKNAKNPNFVLVVTCDFANENNSVPYSYGQEEIEKLLSLNQKLEQFGQNRILFSEGINLFSGNISNRKIACWSLPIVLEVNKKIDNIVQTIKEKHLSPYETVLYIHHLASQIQYSCNGQANTMLRETEATLLGISCKYEHLCCVGYSSFVKAIIDRLNNPNLSAKINQFQIFQTLKKTDEPDFIVAHSANTIFINDSHYGVKGVYFEDPTPFTAPQTDFSACLVPIPDMQHYKGRIYREFKLLSQADNIHLQVNVDGKAIYQIENQSEELRNAILKTFYETLPFQDAQTHTFSKNLQYTKYSTTSFKEAYSSLFSKLGEKDANEKANKALQNAIKFAEKYFNNTAENCFAKEFRKPEKNDEESKEP